MRRHSPLIAALVVVLALAAPPALASEGKDKDAGPQTYFALQPLTAAAIRRDGRRGALTLESGIEAPDPVVMARAKASEPRLRAAYTELLMVYASGLPFGSPPNVDYLGAEMQKATDKVLGRKGARVLLGTAIVN
jgi:hypothetical protein